MIIRNIEIFEFTQTPLPFPTDTLIAWLHSCIRDYNPKLSYNIAYSILSDEALLEINIEFLDHDTYTDIITFPYEVNEHSIESSIHISIERVIENAKEYGVSIGEELLRVMSHGILHLLGWGDHNAEEIQQMRLEEQKWMNKFVQ